MTLTQPAIDAAAAALDTAPQIVARMLALARGIAPEAPKPVEPVRYEIGESVKAVGMDELEWRDAVIIGRVKSPEMYTVRFTSGPNTGESIMRIGTLDIRRITPHAPGAYTLENSPAQTGEAGAARFVPDEKPKRLCPHGVEMDVSICGACFPMPWETST